MEFVFFAMGLTWTLILRRQKLGKFFRILSSFLGAYAVINVAGILLMGIYGAQSVLVLSNLGTEMIFPIMLGALVALAGIRHWHKIPHSFKEKLIWVLGS